MLPIVFELCWYTGDILYLKNRELMWHVRIAALNKSISFMLRIMYLESFQMNKMNTKNISNFAFLA